MGPKYRLMPDKGTTVNGVFIALAIVLFVLVIFEGIVIGQYQGICEDSQQYIDYWRHKTDSMYDVNHDLFMRNLDLRDSIITLKYGLHARFCRIPAEYMNYH